MYLIFYKRELVIGSLQLVLSIKVFHFVIWSSNLAVCTLIILLCLLICHPVSQKNACALFTLNKIEPYSHVIDRKYQHFWLI